MGKNEKIEYAKSWFNLKPDDVFKSVEEVKHAALKSMDDHFAQKAWKRSCVELDCRLRSFKDS